MMKFHKPGRLRMLGGAAAIVVLGGLSLAVGGPGLAHPHPEQTKQDAAAPDRERREERVIVRTVRHDGPGDGRHRQHGGAAGHRGPGGGEPWLMNRPHGEEGHAERRGDAGPKGELISPMHRRTCASDETAARAQRGSSCAPAATARRRGAGGRSAPRTGAQDSELSHRSANRFAAALDARLPARGIRRERRDSHFRCTCKPGTRGRK